MTLKRRSSAAAAGAIMLPLDSIIPYARNGRRHPEEQVTELAAMIKEFGFDQPIVVDSDRVIIKGHGRRLAALKLGLTDVPVVVRTDLTPAQIKAARIADNRIGEKSSNDYELLRLELEEIKTADEVPMSLTGFTEDEAARLLVGESSSNEKAKPKNTEQDESSFDGFEHECPKCGFGFNSDG